MIEIIDGRIRWMEDYNNVPTIELLLSRTPDDEEFRYRNRGKLYYGEVDGVCSFLSWSQTHESGTGLGRVLQMEDGSSVGVAGYWSASAADMNHAGFGPCTEAAVTDDPAAFAAGYTFRATAVTMELLGRYRDRIETTPYRFASNGEHWTRRFDRRLVFPAGSLFTMVQTRDMTEPSPTNGMLSSEQGVAMGWLPSFLPAVLLPSGKAWVKPLTFKEPVPIPEGATVEEVRL